MIFNTAHTKNSIDMDVICLHLSTCIRTIKNLLSIGFLFTGCCRVTRMGDNRPWCWCGVKCNIIQIHMLTFKLTRKIFFKGL